MGRRGRPLKPPTTPMDEAERLSRLAGSALGDDFGGEPPEMYEDPDLAELQDPEVEQLGEPPLIGHQRNTSDLFGEMAGTVGRATSSPLFSQAAQFPNCIQLRVWKWENGVPTGLGVLDAQAAEEDFVRMFFAAMPKPGENRAMFKFRPVDINGRQLAKEFTQVISEHHMMLQQIRREKEMAAQNGQQPWGRDVVVQGGDGGSVYAEEMGRMFEHSVEMAEKQTTLYQQQLEEERRALRETEKARTEERVAVAERSSSVVEKMTEKLMATDKQRSEEVREAQERQHSVVLSTITTTFQQQQEAARLAAEQQRASDLRRAEQDREFYDRQRKESEERRKLERDESEARRKQEHEDWERKWQASEAEANRKSIQVQAEAERKSTESRLDAERRIAAEKADAERKIGVEKAETERRAAAEKAEAERRRDLEKMELELRRDQIRHDSERYLKEIEERRRHDKEESERKERIERERIDRERGETQQRLELQLKQLDVSAQRDREHVERMLDLARQEREQAREFQGQREKMEREAREMGEKERDRQHSLAMKEMEIARERDREHQERMLTITKMQNAGPLSGFGAVTEMLGMDTPELLAKIFGAGGGEGGESSWVDAIPKALTALAEIGKVVTQQPKQIEGPAPAPKPKPPPKQVPVQAQEQKYLVQTADGMRLVSASELQTLQLQSPPGMKPGDDGLSSMPFRPPADRGNGTTAPAPTSSPVPKESAPLSPPTEEEKYAASKRVNTLRRANAMGLEMVQQRNARKAIKLLAAQLRKAPEAERVGIVTAALAKTPDIFHYIKAVTLYAALAEAKVEPAVAMAVATSIRASGMIPDGVLPYDEADFDHMQAAEAMKVAKGAEEAIKADETDSKGSSP